MVQSCLTIKRGRAPLMIRNVLRDGFNIKCFPFTSKYNDLFMNNMTYFSKNSSFNKYLLFSAQLNKDINTYISNHGSLKIIYSIA